jgi:amino acid adenylation domain-containing protein
MRPGYVQDLFEDTVRSFPSDVAIESGDKAMTYRELEDRANTLANFLTSKGTPKGTIIAMIIQDPFEAVIAILGILKAGCAFVSFDPDMPVKRLQLMVGHISPAWFVIEGSVFKLGANLASYAGQEARLVCVGVPPVAAGAAIDAACSFDVLDYANIFNPQASEIIHEPDDISYIYFTSGSTGKPKPIAGRLKGIDHFIKWEIDTLAIDRGTRVSWLLPLTFDGSLRDLFVPLCSGGVICVPDGKQTILDAPKLIDWLNDQRINLIHCVPSLFRSLTNETLSGNDFESLRHILMAGEPLLPSDVKKWMDVFGDRVSLVNLYGTSETTMAKFFHFVQVADTTRQSIPIGKPMPGARAIVIDEGGKVCPPGVIGEILIRTPYRSLGYYKQPELTEQVFIQNPFSGDPHDIVYKTGDMGRVLDNGNFEYLGRKDGQVKVRGVRVELGEVESVLRGHPAVVDVAAIDQEDLSGNKILCVYVVLGSQVSLGALRAYAAEYMPDYMVPSAFIVMDVLPRTISGKVNRRALPSAHQALESQRGDHVAPRTAIEEMVAAIWMRVLGLRSVSIHDSFFQLGGHSLLATQIASRIRHVFQIELPVQTLFEAPTIAKLSQKIEDSRRVGVGMVAPPIKPTPRDGHLQLSFGQQRLWFIDQWEPGSHSYNIDSALQLEGQPRATAMRYALNEVIRRHESLRTAFPTVDGRPVQLISPTLEIELAQTDLTGLLDFERQHFAHRLVRERAERPFDLSLGPLIWMSLLRLEPADHILMFAMHHIVGDAWSLGVFVSELATLYGAFSTGEPSPLPEPSIQYADFARWQRDWLVGDVLESQLEYWTQQLQGAPPVLELPTDYPRSQVRSFQGASESLSLVPRDSFRRLSQEEGATLFIVLLAAFQTLLYRYSGQSDIIVGSTIANRNRSEIEGLIGFFANNLLIRADLSANPRFRELLIRVRDTVLGAYAHQDLPFERLVEEIQPKRDLGRNPLLQVVFSLQNTPSKELVISGLTIKSLAGSKGFDLTQDVTAKFDLTVNIMEAGDELVALFCYNTALFSAATIKRMLCSYRALLRAVASDSDQTIGTLEMLSEEERIALLDVLNNRAISYPQQQRLHERFEAQVERTPDSVAIVFEREHLTYADLNRRSNQLAHHLLSLDASLGSHIGIALERGIEMINAILAVLKTGKAYLPIDPAYPPERFAFVLEDANVTLLLTDDPTLERLSGLPGIVLSIDADRALIARQSDRNPGARGFPEDLAYLIYTSGSTGKPKGVMVTHSSVGRLFDAVQPLFQFDAKDVWVLFHSYAFDFSVWELWGALLYGGRLVMVPYFVSRQPDYFHSFLADEAVTVLNQTPSAFYQFIKVQQDRLGASDVALRSVIFGGEALDFSALERWVELHPEGRPALVNMYGITETTVHVSYRPVSPEDVRARQGSLVGSPIPDVQVHVLDEHLNLVPARALGEIFVGGAGVARGYINRPDLTAWRFTPDPFSLNVGARLYRTGDLARRLHDGDLEYVGRKDQQVKIRGFRIEPAEIEAALKENGRIQQAIVVAMGQADERRLVAYLVCEQGPMLKVDDLHTFLKRKLPEHMIPSSFVFLERLPLTANGKIDRNSLPAPDEARPNLAELYQPPFTETQHILERILAEVLGIERVGIHDNFFELGGHSLLAAQALTKMQEAFQMEFSLRNFFETPTVFSLAESVDVVRWVREAGAPAGSGDHLEGGIL